MRPDEHKAKDSRKYQARKRLQGDATAAETAEARRRSARARDKGEGVTAIRRRNGELPARQEQPRSSSHFSRRKITSNADRYKELTVEGCFAKKERYITKVKRKRHAELYIDEIALDAELGIDRQTTDLVAMLEEKDDLTGGGTSYFKFKEEQLWENDTIQKEELYKNMLQVNFDLFEGIMQQMDSRALLDLPEDDLDLIESAFADTPLKLDKPLVPAFAKNAKGLVLFKPPVIVEKKELDGIYLRNDGSNHRVAPRPAQEPQEEDELDELLALDSKPKIEIKKQSPALSLPMTAGTSLPKPTPGKPLLKKPTTTPSPAKTPGKDDEAWLDDLLG
ncbi:hypothetical protein EC973_002741 [Apophysomyces ossiformis]|uniref:Uncharacterized protein n=1 Tax=Apophysomyces ossiformis TaxID=679940 RepID=A0A8H7BTM6_9FUNG|nr:hypothetical protein EC973_002741 [Apophysomyces ossiformis]